MIEDLSRTIEKILEFHLQGISGTVDIKFDKPNREWSATLAKPTINFYLYDVRENVELRQNQHWELLEKGDPNGKKARLKPSSIRFDCKYMITAWAEKPEDEQQLLSMCIMVLARYRVLPNELFVGKLKDQRFKIPAHLGRHDQLTNPSEIWGALDNDMRATLSYVVTLSINPWEEVEFPVLKSVVVDFKSVDKNGSIVPSKPKSSSVFMGRLTDNDDRPLVDAEVSVVGSGIRAFTNPKGEYILRGLHSGETYTLVIQSDSEEQPKQLEITVP